MKYKKEVIEFKLVFEIKIELLEVPVYFSPAYMSNARTILSFRATLINLSFLKFFFCHFSFFYGIL